MENRNVIRFAFAVGGFTMLSRVLGMVRDVLTAGVFGTSLAMSSFVVAFRIPNLFRALFGEGALSSAFVPVFMDTRQKAGDDEAWRVARRVLTVVGGALLALVALGIAVATALLHYAPGLVEHAPTVLPLARIMFPYLLFICLAALSQAILNAYHRFALPAFTPSLLNITWILFVLFACPLFGDTANERIFGVAWGVCCAGLVQLLAQVPLMMKLGYQPGLEWDTRDERVRKVFRLMGPTTIGQSVTQVNVMINGVLARWAADWAPASLFYAERLLYFPQGILATALSTVLLPVLSGQAAAGDRTQMRDTLNHGLRTLLFVMAPASLGLLFLAEPITQLIYGWGAFNQASVIHTSVALKFYAPGLLFFGLAKVFVPAFYALHNTRTPFRIGLVAVGLNFCMNWFFVLTWPEDIKHAGLALATVLSETFNGLTLAWCLHRVLGNLGWGSVLRSAGRAVASALLMAIGVHYLQWIAEAVLRGYGAPAKLAQAGSVLGSIAVGAAFYFGLALLTRAPEVGFVKDALRRRRERKTPRM